jgi:dihydroorotate dehydrogenase electron transfer subunit
MIQIKARIISNQCIKRNYWHCVIDALKIAKSALAGQFINIKVCENTDPLLRRPFSIHNIQSQKLEILYEVLGKGSEILSGKKVGESISIIGPLGNGFDCTSSGKNPVIIAGGLGVAPLMFLAKALIKKKPIILIGAKTKEQVLCVKEFKGLGLTVKVATDDGSLGYKGMVTDLLKDLNCSMIYACGPHPMLKSVAGLARARGVESQLSLEEHMSCGIGACLGCVVKTGAGLKRVCKEGPVFKGRDLNW